MKQEKIVRHISLTLLLVLAAVAGCKSSPSKEERATQGATLFKQGIADFNGGKVDEGIAELKKAVELEPTGQMGQLFKYDLSRLLLHRAEENDLNGMRALERAKREREEGSQDKAKRSEDEAQLLARKAVVDAREARDHLLWLEGQSFPEPNVFYFLCKAYITLGEFGTARKWLDKFMDAEDLGPEDRARAKQARERLIEAELQHEKLHKT